MRPAVGLPAYTASPAIKAEARRLSSRLAKLLKAADAQTREVASLEKQAERLAGQAGWSSLLTRAAVRTASRAEAQAGAVASRLRVLNRQDPEPELVEFLRDLPDFYARAFRQYRAAIEDHFTKALEPGCHSHAEAKARLHSPRLLPLLHCLDTWVSCPGISRGAKANAVALARENLSHLEAISRGVCPWRWPAA